MSRFDAHNGFVHFVFANEDVYCLKSLAGLDLEKYLYYLLKQSGYQGVYFIGSEDERPAVSVYDSVSQELYAKSDKGAFMTKMFDFLGVGWTGEQQGRVTVPTGTAEQFCRKWFPLLKKEQHQAFVFRLDVFVSLFSGEGRYLLPELIQIGRQQLQSQKNILIIQAPIAASENAKYLLDEKGVFQVTDRKTGRPLCREIQSLLRGAGNSRLYEQMKHELGERCLFFNTFTRGQIRSLVQHYYLVRNPQEEADPQWLADAADFLYCWFASPQLRAAVGPVFSQNERQVFSQLLSDLNHGAVQRAMAREISRLRQENSADALYDLICRQYRVEPVSVCMPADDLIARKLRVLKVKPGQLPEREMTRLQQVIREFQVQRTRLADEALTDLLLECIAQLEEAIGRKDAGTARHILAGLKDALHRDLTFGEAEQVIWDTRKTIIRLSQANFELDERRKDFLARKKEYAVEMKRLREEIQREEPEAAYLSESDPRRIQLASKKERFTQLYHDCRNQDYALAQDTKQSNQNDAAIRQLYLSISAFHQPGVEDLSQVLQNAQQMLVSIESERMSQQREIEDINERINYTFKELAAMEDYPATADRYEATIRALDQEAGLLTN